MTDGGGRGLDGPDALQLGGFGDAGVVQIPAKLEVQPLTQPPQQRKLCLSPSTRPSHPAQRAP
jgi:hypothetical protein